METSKRIGSLKVHQEEAMLMKSAAIDWLRYEKQCELMATEVGEYQADALGVMKDTIYELEIKRSLEDLRCEFTKIHKWDGVSIRNGRWKPHYFYFVVTPDILDGAIAMLEDNGVKAGVMVWNFSQQDLAGRYREKGMFWNYVRVVKVCPRLKEGKVDGSVKIGMQKRMGSEVCRSHHRLVEAFIGCKI